MGERPSHAKTERERERQRDREQGEGGAGKDASCVLGATTDTAEDSSCGLHGAWGRNRDAAFKKKKCRGRKRSGRKRSGRMHQPADVLPN